MHHRSPATTWTLPGGSLTAGGLIDGGFHLVRSLRPADILPGAAAPVLTAALMTLVARAGDDGEPIPAEGLLLAGGTLLFLLLHVALGTGIARLGWEAVRGPLPAAPRSALLPLRVLVLCPALALLPVLPTWTVCRAVSLRSGDLTAFVPPVGADGPTVALYAIVLLLAPFLAFAPAVLAVEGGGTARALLRSAALFRLAWRRSLPVTLVLSLMVESVALGLLIVFNGMTLPGHGSEGPTTGPGGGALRLLVHALLAPAVHATLFVAYLQARVRVEGLDVERAARGAGLWEPARP